MHKLHMHVCIHERISSGFFGFGFFLYRNIIFLIAEVCDVGQKSKLCPKY